MESKFMDNSPVDDSKIGRFIIRNPTVEDAIDDSEVPSSSSSSIDAVLTPVSPSNTERKAADELPTTQVAAPPTALAPGSSVAFKAEESTTPKAEPTVPANGRVRVSHRGGHARGLRGHLGAGTGRGEPSVYSGLAALTQAAAPPPPPGHPDYVHPLATFPMRLPFLSNVGLRGDDVINNLDQLVDTVAQLVRMVEEHRSTITSLTIDNQSAQPSYHDVLTNLYNAADPGAGSAAFPGIGTHHEAEIEDQRIRQHNREVFGHENPFTHHEPAGPDVAFPPQPSVHRHTFIGTSPDNDETAAFNVLLTRFGIPGLSLTDGHGHRSDSGSGSGSDWLGSHARAPRATQLPLPPYHGRAPPEFTMFTPHARQPVYLSRVAIPRHRRGIYPTFDNFMGSGFPFNH